MEDSILKTIKQLIGGSIPEDDDSFDNDLQVHINTVFMSLNQLGIGPKNVYFITGYENKWSEFTSTDIDLESIKTYIYLKVRLIFDPPTSSIVLESINSTIKELEWRLYVSRN